MVLHESGEQRAVLSERIRRTMASKGWTQAKLAKASGYDERTIRNVLNAHSTRFQTVMEICKALDIEVEGNAAETNEVAAEDYGAYAKINFAYYAGRYFAYRRMFAKSRKIMRSCVSISWSHGHLMFSERQSFNCNADADLDHGGHVYISAHTGLIHLTTVFQGAVRLVTLTKMQNQTMRGVVLTQSERKLFYQPSVSAFLLKRIDSPVDEHSFDGRAGPLASDDPEYEPINAELREIEADVIFIAQSQDA